MTKRERELEAMLKCSEELVRFWEQQAKPPVPAERYELPLPWSFRR